MKENREYKNEALAALKSTWPQAVLAVLAYLGLAILFAVPTAFNEVMLLSDPTNLALASQGSVWSLCINIAEILVFCPLLVGLVNCFKIILVDGDDRTVTNTFKVGFGNYWHNLWGVVLCKIFVVLWSLLLVIPGIIKSLSYAMTNYILVDRPDLSANEAINLSKEMMYGHKFDLFYLYLSFAGWFILCILTLGIGYLWLLPYVQTAQASFYLDVKADYERRTAVGA